jgi:predicted amidohydrolase YtcJ
MASGCAPGGNDAAAPDAVFFNGKVVTVDPSSQIAQAFAVRGETFVAVGGNDEVLARAGANTRRIDLGGRTVTPGLSDSHDHLYASGRVMRGISLVGATSVDEVLNRLRDSVAKAQPGKTVFGGVGWRAPVTRSNLDQLSTTVPIVVLRGRRGEAVMNTAALAKAGITKESPIFMGKPVPTDAKGELTGEMPSWPYNLYAIDRVVPPPTAAEEEELIAAGQRQRNALGITSIRDLANWPHGMRAYVRMWQKGALTLRVSMGIDMPDENDPAAALRAQGVVPGFGDKWLRIDSAGEEPWPPTTSTAEEFAALVREINALGWRPAPHVPSNASLDQVLQAYEAADADAPIRGKRWFVEHIPNATPEQMDRLARLGVIVSTQVAGYRNPYETAVNRLGEAQAQRQTPVRDLLDHGLVVVPGSDYGGPTPETESLNNPFVPLYFYVARKTSEGRELGPQQAITREEALKIATYNSAYAAWDENIRGSIEPGKLADFVILSADYLTVPEEQILEIQPLATYVGAQKVFSAPIAGDAL